MKIGYVVETPVSHNLTGGVRSFLGFIKELKDNTDVEPFVLCSEEWQFTEELKKYGIPYIVSKMYRPFVSYPKPVRFFRIRHFIKQLFNSVAKRRGYRFFKKNKVELIHINSQFAGLVGAEIAKKLNIPYIYHIREALKEGFGVSFFNEKYSTRIIQNSASIITISDFIFNKTRLEYPEGKIIKIYNGIKLPEVDPVNLCFQDVINACIVGRVCSEKNQFDAVKAIEILKVKHGINVVLHVVGWEGCDPYETEIKKYIEHNNLSNNVILVPFTNDVVKVTQKCQIGFVCSEHEAFGRVTIESMSLGQIVFASNAGANPEIIKNGRNGFIYSLHDYEDLADKINKVLRFDIKTLKSISEQAILDCKEKYSIEETAKRIYSTYLCALDSNKKSNEVFKKEL